MWDFVLFIETSTKKQDLVEAKNNELKLTDWQKQLECSDTPGQEEVSKEEHKQQNRQYQDQTAFYAAAQHSEDQEREHPACYHCSEG